MVTNTDAKRITENPRGGCGATEVHEMQLPECVKDRLRLLAKVILRPHTTIGAHPHAGEAEAYYILSGEGIFVENDGSRVPVKAGDFCTMEINGTHGLENPGDQPMEIIALIYLEKNKA